MSVKTNQDYLALNATLNLYKYDEAGKPLIQFSEDKEAVRQYFLQHVNENTVYFHDLREKIDYLLDNDYYEKEFLDQYSFAFIKRAYRRAYSKKFRFETFVGAYKYYTAYTLKTFDGKRYLERYEDRVTAVALYLAAGDEARVFDLIDEIISGRFQPATPTFLNAGKKQRGDLVSCFPTGSLVDVAGGRKAIEDVTNEDFVLTHDGTYKAVLGITTRKEQDGLITLDIAGSTNLVLTPEHPVLVYSPGAQKINQLIDLDGSQGELTWVAAKDITKGAYVVSSYPKENHNISSINILEYVPANPRYTIVDGLVRTLNVDPKTIKKNGIYNNSSNSVKNSIPLDSDFGRFLGYYLAEGYVMKNQTKEGVFGDKGINFTFGSTEFEYIDDVAMLADKLFGLVAKTKVNRDGSTNVYVNSSLVGQFMHSLVGTGFAVKSLPDIIMHAGFDFQRELLIGAFRGDGCTTSSAVTMALVNPELIHQLRQISLRCGLLARTRTFINQADNLTGNLDITGFPGNEYDFILDVAKNTDKFIGATATHYPVARWVEGQPAYRVQSTSFDSQEVDVFNLEVEGNHTYSVSGHVVHNCFLLRIEDNMESIARAINSSLQLSKRGGGVALLLTNLREEGAPIKKIEDQSSGVIPVMKLLENSFAYANQMGARNGSGAVYINAHHPDIITFLDSHRENADEAIRIKSLSLGVVIPDITYELARNNEDMYLFSPYDVERVYGVPMSDISISEKYREMVDNPDIKKKKIKAREFFQILSEVQLQSGYPYIMFEDTVNRANPIQGRINMSNLCSEILQVNTPSTYKPNLNYDTVGNDISCNLGSLNIAHVMDSPDFAKSIEVAIRALTTVSDMTHMESVPSIEKGNDGSHSVGLGGMNLHGFLARERIFYGSEEGVDFTNIYFLTVAYNAIRASNKLAIERNARFDNFENSKYATGEYFDKYTEKAWLPKTEKVVGLFARSGIHIPNQADWEELKASVMEHGIYNAYLQAVPPTGSISYINNSTASIHPITSKIEIRKEGKLGRVYYPAAFMTNDNLDYYQDAYEIGYEKIIDTYAAATQHVDQGLSCTLFFVEGATTRTLTKAQLYAFKHGIKTLYYSRLRQVALAGTDVEGCVSCAL